MNDCVLTLHFRATECNGWPTVRILIDDDIYHDVGLDQDETFVHVPIRVLDGSHLLKIERYGKNNNNMVFVDGIILEDQIVELLDIYVNDIKLNDTLKYRNALFKYHDQEVNNGFLWGPNGTFEWKFETPLITWLIYSKQQIEDDSNDLYIPGKRNVSVLFNEIEKFKKYLNEKKF